MDVSCTIRTLRLAAPFVISRGAKTAVANLFVELEEDGRRYTGEGAPVYYLGQSAETLLRAAASAPALLAHDPDDIENTLGAARAIHPHQSGWLCALDLALHDRAGRRAGRPLWQLLHGREDPIPDTSYTISLGTPDEMLAQAEQVRDFPALKVKCGGPDDLAALRRLAREDGRPLRVDANAAWSLETTRTMLRELPDLGVELLEQPLPLDRTSQLRALVAESPIPIVLDESIQNGLDVHLHTRHCHGINIKLAKCGGLLEALRMIGLARHYGLRVMLGSMIESSLAVTALAHLGPLADWVDFDAPLLLADDPYTGLQVAGGRVALPAGPGLGVKENRNAPR